MTTQDPELSAALGWPGGISDPVLDRAQLLQMVAALRLASQQALEALTAHADLLGTMYLKMDAITALRAALAQQDEPVEPVAYFGSAYVNENGVHITTVLGPVAIPQDAKLYTAPPQRTMVPLTEEEIDAEWRELDGEVSTMFMRVLRKFARAVEKTSWEKNHGQA